MNITYEKCGDYLIPNLIPDPEPEGELRKFGLMRKSYLENYRRGICSGLLLSGELKKHLLMIQEQAEERFDLLVEQMAKQEGGDGTVKGAESDALGKANEQYTGEGGGDCEGRNYF